MENATVPGGGVRRAPRRRRAMRVLMALAALLAASWLAALGLLETHLPPPSREPTAFPDPMDRDLSLRQAFDGLPGEGGVAALRLLDGNVEAWAERWRLLAGAREHLTICYFILDNDVFGAAFLGHLIRKAREGVRIRVLLDALGTKMSRDLEGNDYLDALVNTEVVEVRMYRPLRFRLRDTLLTFNPAAYYMSEHDKILVADDRLAMTGGRNIAAHYFAPPADDPKAFRDVDVVLTGRAVAAALSTAFARQFESDQAHPLEREVVNLKRSSEELLLAYEVMDAWLTARPLAPEAVRAIDDRNLPWLDQLEDVPGLRGALNRPRMRELSAPVHILDSPSRLGAIDDPVTRSLIRLLRSAWEEVVIYTPYVILLDDVVEVLAEVVDRGVRVTIVTNSPASTDNSLSGAIFTEQWPDLLARIPALRLLVIDDERNLHAKVAVLDRTVVLVGTYNLDPLSMTMNSEVLAVIWSADAAEQVLSGTASATDPARTPLVEYRIAIDPEGRVLRDGDGEPVISFGSEDHLEEGAWSTARRLVPLVRLVRAFRERSVIF